MQKIQNNYRYIDFLTISHLNIASIFRVLIIKALVMRTLFKALIVIVFYCNMGYSQENSSRLKYHSFSISPLSVYFDNSSGGLAVNIDVAFNKDEHVFKIFGLLAGEFSVLQSSTEEFFELNLLYGREVSVKKWFHLDYFGGLGYFQRKTIIGTEPDGWFNYLEYRYELDNTLGFHLQSKIRFQTGKLFSLGLHFDTNLNSLNSIYSTGLFLQWQSVN